MTTPAVGEEVIDGVTGKTAVVRDIYNNKIWLQRPGGGIEWTRRPNEVRAVEPAEEATQ